MQHLNVTNRISIPSGLAMPAPPVPTTKKVVLLSPCSDSHGVDSCGARMDITINNSDNVVLMSDEDDSHNLPAHALPSVLKPSNEEDIHSLGLAMVQTVQQPDASVSTETNGTPGHPPGGWRHWGDNRYDLRTAGADPKIPTRALVTPLSSSSTDEAHEGVTISNSSDGNTSTSALDHKSTEQGTNGVAGVAGGSFLGKAEKNLKNNLKWRPSTKINVLIERLKLILFPVCSSASRTKVLVVSYL